MKKIIKPFSVEEWRNGAKIATRDGREVRILCTDLKNKNYPIIAAICKEGEEAILNVDANGCVYKKYESKDDLVIVEEASEHWADDEDAVGEGWYIGELSDINHDRFPLNDKCNYNVFATEKQAKSALAMARISQLMAHDERYGGVVTDEEWKSNVTKYCIERLHNVGDCVTHDGLYQFLAFHTAEQRDLFLAENERLVKDYLMTD